MNLDHEIIKAARHPGYDPIVKDLVAMLEPLSWSERCSEIQKFCDIMPPKLPGCPLTRGLVIAATVGRALENLGLEEPISNETALILSYSCFDHHRQAAQLWFAPAQGDA